MRDQAPPLYAAMQAKVLAGKGSRPLAVKVNCLQCCSWVRAEVTACQVKDCPMWHFRPYQGRENAQESDSAAKIEAYGDSGEGAATTLA